MKKQSYYLLIVLIIILVFIIGVRYGERIEKTNAVVQYLLKLTPTPQIPLRQKADALEFKEYTNKNCGVSFLYPASLKKEQESSWSASFSFDTSVPLEFSCFRSFKYETILNDNNIASKEVVLNKKTILGKRRIEKGINIIYLKTINPFSSINIEIRIIESLLPLFEKTFAFIR